MVRKLIQQVIRRLRGATSTVKSAPSVPEVQPKPTPAQVPESSRMNKPSGRRRGNAAEAPSISAAPSLDAAPSAVAWDPSMFQVPVAEGKTRFHDLNLPNEILHAIADLQFMYCTPIQAAILPHTLSGRDAFGQAQTGTGKTAAFLITIFTRLLREAPALPAKSGAPRALILAPTRELCLQIHKDARALGRYVPFSSLAVFGGMDYEKQRDQLRKERVDIVVATPGRLIDFKRRGDLDLRHVEILVIDEADRMLDMGFIPDVRTIVHSTPPKDRRQTLFFSATLTPDVRRLAAAWTRDPVTVEIAPEKVAVDTVEQVTFIVTSEQKFALLYNLLTRENARRVICFVNRRDEAETLLNRLRRYGLDAELLSGAVAQEKRIRTLERFRRGEFRVLVATDVAGRGIHVNGVTHVVNYNLPEDPEDYVHRIGRTGRAGASGTSINFADENESFHIPAIEKFIGKTLSCTHPEDDWLVLPPPPEQTAERSDRERKRAAAGQGDDSGGPPRRRRRRAGRGRGRLAPRKFDEAPADAPRPPPAPDIPV
ncbi:MAG: DEAD/DEAH box helicase [Kiritimatiellae bacterium]|nr:DEAD/DEAH box helicase [Kiritimatiellia bacterium]MDW8458810.1 DEAD/DEAH box helicase [Verrucomicrobiota bacterium]